MKNKVKITTEKIIDYLVENTRVGVTSCLTDSKASKEAIEKLLASLNGCKAKAKAAIKNFKRNTKTLTDIEKDNVVHLIYEFFNIHKEECSLKIKKDIAEIKKSLKALEKIPKAMESIIEEIQHIREDYYGKE